MGLIPSGETKVLHALCGQKKKKVNYNMNNVLHESMTLFLWKYRIGLVNLGKRLYEEVNLISGSKRWTGVRFEKKKTPDKGKNTGKGMKSHKDRRCVGKVGGVQCGRGIQYRKGGVESDTGASCSLNYHLSTSCQKETYWSKISTMWRNKKLHMSQSTKHSG